MTLRISVLKFSNLSNNSCPDAYVRVDHVPTMAGEDNDNPGYCSLGRLYAIGYLKGLIEMANKG